MASDPGPDEPQLSMAEKRLARIFLVVVDDSAERAVALRYACLRSIKGGGRVALLRVIEPVEITEWAGVGDIMRAERREEAEAMLGTLAAEVNRVTGTTPILFLREGNARDELIALTEEERSISILVLASAITGDGPGPLISALTGRYASRLRVPLTIVPGALSDSELDRVT